MARTPLFRTGTLLTFVSFTAVALPLVLAGCGKKKKSLTDPLEEMDLATVCAGTGEPRAKAYSKESPDGHGMAMFSRGGEDKETEKLYAHLLTDVVPLEPQNVELVACAVRTAQTKVETCDYEDDHHLETYDATYEISIREARTAAVLQTKTVSLAARQCFGFTSFKEKTDKAYPDPELSIAELARDIVLPREGGAPVPPSPFAKESVDDTTLYKVCYGFPEKRAAAYEKAAGKVSPTLLLARKTDRVPFNSPYNRGFEPWKAKDAKDYQLVACITEKSRSKNQECKFEEKQPARLVDLYNATYEVTLREARTAKVVATQTIAEEGEKTCPTFYIFNGTTHAEELPLGGPATLAFVKPLIAP